MFANKNGNALSICCFPRLCPLLPNVFLPPHACYRTATYSSQFLG